LTDDTESLIDDTIDAQKLKNAKLKTGGYKNIEVASIKHLPTLFFIIFIIVIALLITQFVPTMYAMKGGVGLYKQKLAISYIPQIISEQSLTVKALLVSSQFIFIFVIVCLTSLIRQRISVPELTQEKWRNYLILITGATSVFCMISILYYNKETLQFSRNYLGLVDNCLFVVYIFASFTYCYMTYVLLSKMNIREVPKDCSCLMFKKYLMLLMGIQLFCYCMSVALVSYYHPVIDQEKFLMSLLIYSMSINSTLFLVCQAFFIFSLKYDLYYVNMNLQIRPDLEYFLDLTDYNNIKGSL